MADRDRQPTRSTWTERLLLPLGALFVVVGVATYALRDATPPDPRHGGITGDVIADLVPAGHIEAEPGALRGFNLLIITTDTTRADHLGAYGNRSIQTPTLDGLARNGVLFSNNITPSPSTLPSHSSILTGLYPVHHGARANGSFRLEDPVTTLAERLSAAGYRTGAVISAFVLDSRFGLDQGFDFYHDDLTRGVKLSPHSFRERPAEFTNEAALPWLRENADGPFFLWLHYFDPHAAYLPPEPFRSDYPADLYDGEIAYADGEIGKLLAELETLGVRDRTLVVYTADHGEGLGEHGEQTHSLLTYDSTLRVPLIMSAPAALPRGVVVERQAATVDVAPTALSLLGLEVPESLDGRDWTRPLDPAARSVYFETISTMTLHGWAPLAGIRRDDYKYVRAPEPELYDLRSDPKEIDNLHDELPEIAAELSAELDAMIALDPLLLGEDAPDVEMDEDVRRQLEALGYVQSRPTGEGAQRDLDPKVMVYHWERVQKGIHLRAQGHIVEAIEILEECVSEVEGDLFARSVLTAAHLLRGNYDRAMELLERSAELAPDDPNIKLTTASVYLRRRDRDKARALIAELLEEDPENTAALLTSARIAIVSRRPGAAMRILERVIELDPGTSGPSAYHQIGMIHLRAYRLDKAREAFEHAIEIDALNGGAHDGLANVLIAEGDTEGAAEMLAKALRFDPNQPRALATLAALRARTGQPGEAMRLARRSLSLSPVSAEAHNIKGLLHRREGDLERAEEHYLAAIDRAPYLDEPHLNLAQLRLLQGRNDEAMDQFGAALAANKRSRVALANIGANHFNQGREDKALGYYRRALTVDPNYALVHRNVSSIFSSRGQPARAAHHLRRSLEIEPGQADAEKMRNELYHLERELEERGAKRAEPKPEPASPAGES